ncbi:MAG: flavodoxin [Oscillospiraceae bacterium]|jgi:flavodoxin|nr:flavodoxin [Oscillospiraceae bacterium]
MNKVAVRYYTRTGNTKKLADAIAEVFGVKAETIDVPLDGTVDVLFFGSSVYAFDVDEEVKKYIGSLDRDTVKLAAAFSTAALVQSTYKRVKKLFEEKGIPVSAREFHCKGEFKIANKGRPGSEDLERAREFAREFAE